MKRWWRAILALLGSAVVVVMVWHIGPTTVLDGLRRGGWAIAPILALQLAVYGLFALSWWLTMRPGSERPGYLATLRISLIGFAMNFITPMVNAGGEPYRIAALAPRLGVARATGSVLLFVLVHAVASIMLWITAIVLTVTRLDPDPTLRLSLLVVSVVLLAALGIVLSGHRDGVVVRLAALLARLRMRRLSMWLASRHETFAAVDAEIIQVWHDRPARLAAAILVDYGGRWVNAIELMLVAGALGVPLSFMTAVTFWGFLSLGMNLFFFLPWELGSREGTIYALSQGAGLPNDFAGLAVVLGRVRELTWAAIGVVLLWWEARTGGIAPVAPSDD